MLLTNSAFEFIEQVDLNSDIPALIESFQALIGKFGMNSFIIGDLTQPVARVADRLWASTFPEEWMTKRSLQNYVSIDPVISRILARNDTIRWQETRSAGDDAGGRVLDEASEFRMKDGFALPIYSREGFVVGISMATESYELGKQDEICLHMASIYFHAKLEALRAKSVAPPRGSRLTRRERECLSWVASGKTDWEISQILNIAEQTVHEYVQNALIKLNATTRAQAVAVAIYTKQITP